MKRLLIPIGASVLLGGCATVDPRPAFSDVDKSVSERTGQRPTWTRSVADGQGVADAVRELLLRQTPECLGDDGQAHSANAFSSADRLRDVACRVLAPWPCERHASRPTDPRPADRDDPADLIPS